VYSVLSFDITHLLTDLLIAMQAAAHRPDRPQTPVLAVVLIRPPDTARPGLRAERVPIPGHAWYTQPGGTIGVLSTLAVALRSPAGTALQMRAQQRRPDEQALAFAPTYTYQAWAGLVRCLDAVDVPATSTTSVRRWRCPTTASLMTRRPGPRSPSCCTPPASRIPQPAHYW
jgi:hypothetical protein